MNLQKTKILRTLSKGVLVLTGLFLLGFLGWTVYRGVKFRPYKVRVTNVTDSAFTVSWVTDSPMPGIVYYGEKDSFLPGPLAWLGKRKAVDDRDFSDAQSECVSRFNENASKNKDENFTVDVSGFDCNDIKVWKYGKYYTHHVTVQNLDAEKEYFFRVGDGVISYGKNSGTYVTGEVEGVEEFKTKTSPLFSEVLAPNPAYGTTETVFQTPDGFYSYDKDYDSIVFLSIKNSDGMSFPLLSAVANNDGGWSIDLSNLRDEEGKPVSIGGSTMVFMPQSKNHKSFVFQEFEYGGVAFPIRLPGNTEEDVKKQDVVLSTELLTKIISKAEANYNDVGCSGTGNYGRLQYCGDQCYREWKRGSEVCGWEKVSSGCSAKPCTCPGESCNPPAPTPPTPPTPPAPSCPIYGSPIIGDFTTVCHQSSCTCTNSLAESTTVTCGNKCKMETTTCSSNWGTWKVVNGDKECQNLPSQCNRNQCTPLCYTESYCKTLITPANNPPVTPPSQQQCYYWSGGLIADGSCNAVMTPASGCVGKNYYLSDATCGGQAGYYTFNYLKLAEKCHPTGPVSLSYTSFSACEEARKATIKEKDWFSVQVIDLGIILEKVGHLSYEGTSYICCPYSRSGGSIVKNKQLTTVSGCTEMLSIKEEEGEKSSFLDIKECAGLPVSSKDSGFLKKLSFSSMAQGENSELILYLPEEGIHIVKFLESETPLSLLGGENKKYLFFENRDGVEGYQSPTDPQNPKENEDILITQTSVVLSVSQETTAKKISLKRGINIISFNFLPSAANEEKKMNSSEFLKLVNESDFNVSRISYFAAGQWNGGVTYDIETNETKGVPFDLVFGKGYVVIAEQDCTISIPGYNIESAVPIAFSSGWNLVGVHGQNEAYTAKTFIESINTIEGLKANNVSWWPTSRGMYQGYQLQNGQEYGQDFPISPLNGYFVRIAEFTPKEDTCKSIIWNPSGEMNGECGSNN